MAVISDGTECTTKLKAPYPTGPRGQQFVIEDAGHDKPGCLVLYRTDGSGTQAAYWLWVDSNGKLRIHSAEPSDQDSDGTVVGTQS